MKGVFVSLGYWFENGWFGIVIDLCSVVSVLCFVNLVVVGLGDVLLVGMVWVYVCDVCG